MFKEILYSVFWNKCPRCHKGNVFETNSAYNLKLFDKMHKTCSCCGEVFEKEPGFFYGAMYVSYALMVGWFLISWGLDYLFFKLETWQYILFISTTILLFAPLTFRISRLIWLNFFVRFDKEKCSCPELSKQ